MQKKSTEEVLSLPEKVLVPSTKKALKTRDKSRETAKNKYNFVYKLRNQNELKSTRNSCKRMTKKTKCKYSTYKTSQIIEIKQGNTNAKSFSAFNWSNCSEIASESIDISL